MYGFLIIDRLPEKAAVVIQLDRAYLWTFEKALCDPVIKSSPFDHDRNLSFVVCFILDLRIFDDNKIHIILI